MFNRLREYIKDEEFRLTIFEDRIYATNYQEILSLEEERISIRTKKSRIIIKGKNLTLNKLLDFEILIVGEVSNIEVQYD